MRAVRKIFPASLAIRRIRNLAVTVLADPDALMSFTIRGTAAVADKLAGWGKYAAVARASIHKVSKAIQTIAEVAAIPATLQMPSARVSTGNASFHNAIRALAIATTWTPMDVKLISHQTPKIAVHVGMCAALFSTAIGNGVAFEGSVSQMRFSRPTP
jgi:hypothetical protein